MEERKIVYTEKKYLRPVKDLTCGRIYPTIKEMCGVVYGLHFREFNKVGKAIEQNKRIKGNYYIFLDN